MAVRPLRGLHLRGGLAVRGVHLQGGPHRSRPLPGGRAADGLLGGLLADLTGSCLDLLLPLCGRRGAGRRGQGAVGLDELHSQEVAMD